MYQRIPVPLDGSTLSECAIDRARAIASGCKVPRIVLLRVLDYATPELPRHVVSYIGEERMREVERSGREEAEGYLSSWKENLERDGVVVTPRGYRTGS